MAHDRANPDIIRGRKQYPDTQIFETEIDMRGHEVESCARVEYDPVDVREIDDPKMGWVAFHDGSGGDNQVGLAFYDGDNWMEISFGTVIT